MSILAFAGSNSSASINYQLVVYTASIIENRTVKKFDMSEKAFPMYSYDHEKNDGIPEEVTGFLEEIRGAEGLIIAVNEHNGNLSAYFKNLIDWLSRADKDFLSDKRVFLMSTSHGKRGAMSALSHAENTLPRFGATISASFSLPSFGENFSVEEQRIINPELQREHQEALNSFLKEMD
ncbi:NADPH-dependent FMN reductase [Sinomicrobium sp.]